MVQEFYRFRIRNCYDLMGTSRASKRQSLLGIGGASRLLGVSEVTLRRWTDQGRIPAFLTPGGHRRYDRATLRDFIAQKPRVHSKKDVIARIKDTPPLHREMARTHLATASWYAELDRQSRRALAAYGRRLLGLVVNYIAIPSRRKDTVALVRQLGHQFGEELTKQSLSLTDSMEAFLLHRNLVVKAVTDLLKGEQVLNERAAEAIPLLTQVMDEALVALITAHQSRQERSGTAGQKEVVR